MKESASFHFNAGINIEDKTFTPNVTIDPFAMSSVNNYEALQNLPAVNGITILGDNSGMYYGLQDDMVPIPTSVIDTIYADGSYDPDLKERYLNEIGLLYAKNLNDLLYASTEDLDLKVNKEEGYGLSQENFTPEEKQKLDNMVSGGEPNKIDAIHVNGVNRPPNAQKVVSLTVPVRLSQLENDTNYQTLNQVTNIVNGVIGGFSRENVLDNPQGNIIQNGLTEWTGADYTADRWRHGRAGQGVVTVTGDILRMERTLDATAMEFLTQLFEASRLLTNKTYTLSFRYRSNRSVNIACVWDSTGSAGSKSITLPASTTWTIGQLTFQTGSTLQAVPYVQVGLEGGSTALIGDYVEFSTKQPFAKLELGSFSTLANDGPVNYQKELAKCEAYQIKIAGLKDSVQIGIGAHGIRENYIDFLISLPTTLIKNPSAMNLTGFVLRVVDSLVVTQAISGFTFSMYATYTGIIVRANKVAHGLTSAYLHINNILLNANL